MGSKKVILHECRLEDSYTQTTAEISRDRELVVEYYDRSSTALKWFGDSDLEHWTTVKREEVDQVLLGLLKDRFESHVDFRNWLDGKHIRYELSSY